MKKFIKWSLITAGICMALGIVLLTISVLVGGHRISQILKSNEGLDKKIAALADTAFTTINFATDGEWFPAFDGDIVVMGENLTKIDTSYEVSIHEIESLDIKVGAGELVLTSNSELTDIVRIDVKGVGECAYDVKDGVLYLDGFNQIIGDSGVIGEIEVYIPEGMTFNEVKVEVGAGTIELDKMNANTLEASIGAGEMIIEQMDAQMFSAKIGAGSLQTEDVSTVDAELDVSLGECIFEGSITGNLEAECDMGNLELTLNGKQEDHNYAIDCKAGNIDIENWNAAGFMADKEIDNGVTSNFEISCNMGNITIEFED